MEEYIIGVDIGGTKIASGIVTKNGKILKKIFLDTYAKQGIEVSLKQVFLSIEQLLECPDIDKSQIKAIGICAPGPLNPIKGIIYNPPNLLGWKDVPIVEIIKQKFNIKTKLENDANAAGMAEVLWGSAKGYNNVLYVTVSTGIGTGIIINKKIFHGKNGLAGEAGHVTIDYNSEDVICNCGNKGCIEAFASGSYTVKHLIEKLKKNKNINTQILDIVNGDIDKITMKTISQAAKTQDKVALEVIEEQTKFLAIWLGSMISILDPEIIVIGGGVSLIGDLFINGIKKNIKEHTINKYANMVLLVQASLKENIGIYAASSIFFS